MNHPDEETRTLGTPEIRSTGSSPGLAETSTANYGPTEDYREQPPLDPDRPEWGAGAGISAWLLSVGSIILVPIGAIAIWILLLTALGRPPSPSGTRDLIFSRTGLLIQILSTIGAHVVTILICWTIVTKMGQRPFLKSLGWNWANRSPLYWTGISVAVIVLLLGVSSILIRFIPQSNETPFDEMLKSGFAVRIAVAVLATVSAPLVEEIVYRGVLYSGLRRHLPTIPTVAIVTVAFTMVHVPQYSGAWVTLSALTLLSLILTIVRATTRSILPCVWIHLLSNAFECLVLLFAKGN